MIMRWGWREAGGAKTRGGAGVEAEWRGAGRGGLPERGKLRQERWGGAKARDI